MKKQSLVEHNTMLGTMKFIDFAESSLKKQIKDGNTTATTFFLRTRGRKRGYNEKQEIDLTSGDERIKININLGD